MSDDIKEDLADTLYFKPTPELCQRAHARIEALEAQLADEQIKWQRECMAKVVAEAQLAAAREALKPFAKTGWMLPFDAERDGLTVIAYIHADSRRELDLSSSDFFRAAATLAALASLPAPEAAPTREEIAKKLMEFDDLRLWELTEIEVAEYRRRANAILALKSAPAK